jgi:hypothetical protein
MRSVNLLAGFILLAGVASAYTRAYIVNDTGTAAYGLHVTLDHAAKPGSAGSGLVTETFVTSNVGPDGLTLDFRNPLDPKGIQSGQTVSIGWQDLDGSISGQIVSYWWTDAQGNLVGSIHYGPPPGSGGSGGSGTNGSGGPGGNPNPSGTGSQGGNGNGDTGDGGDGYSPVLNGFWPGTGPSGPYGSNGSDGSNGSNGDNGSNEPSGGTLTENVDPLTQAPEPDTLSMVLGAMIASGAVLWMRRRPVVR